MQESETKRLVPDPILFFKKALCKVKASDLHLNFKCLHTTKTNCMESRLLIRDRPIFYRTVESFRQECKSSHFTAKGLHGTR